jgi:hypothetical protein
MVGLQGAVQMVIAPTMTGIQDRQSSFWSALVTLALVERTIVLLLVVRLTGHVNR